MNFWGTTLAKKKEIAPIELLYPSPLPYTSWIVLGLDLSLSRSGYALYKVTKQDTRILAIGSIQPGDTKMQVWSRCSLLATSLLEIIRPIFENVAGDSTGFLISAEAPTPRNDFLSSVHRVVNTVLLGKSADLWEREVRILNINASTLRSTLGLVQRGAKNKDENIAKAYEFIDETAWPGLDTDSCDAVLMGAIGVFSSQILMGNEASVPAKFQRLLCDATKVSKGSELRPRIETRGLMHCNRYWFSHEPGAYKVTLRDARFPRKAKASKILVTL